MGEIELDMPHDRLGVKSDKRAGTYAVYSMGDVNCDGRMVETVSIRCKGLE